MRRDARSFGRLLFLLGGVCLAGPGCGLLDLLLGGAPAGDGAAFLLPPNAILVVFDNQSGLPVSVNAGFVISEQDVRQTTRLLEESGPGATATLVRTAAERIEVSARVADRGQQVATASPLYQPGHVLLDRVLVRLVDYQPGDTLNIVIPPPPPDCNENGEADADEIASGTAADCDGDSVPDICQEDRDGDGVIDACDNCPESPDARQTDADSDGLGDACDTEACCLADGSCSDALAADCLAAGGVPHGPGTDCAGTPCPQPTGACCLSDGLCEELTAGACDAAEGAYQGDGTDCRQAKCIEPAGACCFGRFCSVLSRSGCESEGGLFQGMGTDCETVGCPEPTGACCLFDGLCRVTTPAECDQMEGDYQGDGTLCLPPDSRDRGLGSVCPANQQACPLPGDVNGDGAVDGRDVAAFIRVKTGDPSAGDRPACANFGHGADLGAEAAAFASRLLNQPAP